MEEYLLSLLLSIGSRESVELEHLGDVLLVCLTDGYCGSIVVEIIILGTEGQAALEHIEDVHGYVLLVGCEVRTVIHAETQGCILDLQFLQISLGLCCSEFCEQRLHGCDAFLVAAVGIECHLVEIREFSLDGSFLVGLLLEFCKD